MRFAHPAWLGALALAGCYIAPTPERERPGDEPSQPSGDGAESGTEDAPAPPKAPPVREPSMTTTAVGKVPESPPQHPACRFPATEAARDTTRVWLWGAQEDQPLLNAWSTYSCDEVEPLYPCDSDDYCPFSGYCVGHSAEHWGYCVPSVECTAGVPLSHRDGSCSLCIPAATKAALCCSGAAGFDCRRWPFEVRSKPGEPCVEEGDCESGLVCADAGGHRYPTCVCPWVHAEMLDRPTDCETWSEPGTWGASVAEPLPSCLETAPGWIDELMVTPVTYSDRPPSAARAPDGTIHLAFAAPSALQHAVVRGSAFTIANTIAAEKARSVRLTIDIAGTLHIAYSETVWAGDVELRDLSYLDSSNWSKTTVATGLSPTAIRIDARGEPVIAASRTYYPPNSGSTATIGMLLRRQHGAWPQEMFAEQPGSRLDAHLGFDQSDRPVLYWLPAFKTSYEGGAYITRNFFVAGSSVEQPSWMDSAIDPEGVANLVFDGSSDLQDFERGYGQVQLFRDTVRALPELLFKHENRRYVGEQTTPAIAFGADGARYVAHRSPEGLKLRRNAANSTAIEADDVELVSRHAPMAFELAIDGDDEPHLFYVSPPDIPGIIVSPDLFVDFEHLSEFFPGIQQVQLRHIRRGTCP